MKERGGNQSVNEVMNGRTENKLALKYFVFVFFFFLNEKENQLKKELKLT